MAGLRIGFGVANPKLLSGLFKVKDSFNIDAVAIAVGSAAIRDQAYKNACSNKIKMSRITLARDLNNLGFKVLDSHGNFVLVTSSQGNAELLYLGLKQQGILVRYFNQPRLEDRLRISVGTEEQNQILVEALVSLNGNSNPNFSIERLSMGSRH